MVNFSGHADDKRPAWFFYLLLFVTLALTLDMGISIFCDYKYLPDHNIKGDKYWRQNSIYRSSRQSSRIPRQIPGPRDTWAGGKSKSLIIDLPRTGEINIDLNLADSHETAPPVLSVTVDGAPFAEINTSKGAGANPAGWTTKGISSNIQITIPAEMKARVVTITTSRGAWIVLGGMTISISRPWWGYLLVVAGWIGSALLALRTPSAYAALPAKPSAMFVGAVIIGALVLGSIATVTQGWIYSTLAKANHLANRIDQKVATILHQVEPDQKGTLYYKEKLVTYEWYLARYAAAPLFIDKRKITTTLPTPGDKDCRVGVKLDYGTLCFGEERHK